MTATLERPSPVKAKRVRVKHPAGYRRPDTSELLPLGEYDLIVVAFSGGKDSLVGLRETLARADAAGVPRERVEAWHHLVDGEPGSPHNWDWPVTDAYCAAVCRVLGVTYRRSWREGGLSAETLKTNARTRPVVFETPGGRMTAGGKNGTVGTRGRHPAPSPDLFVRWCSPVVKIDVCSAAIANDPRLKGKKVLLVTGERRDESGSRSTYATVERRKGTTTGGRGRKPRRVDQYRMILEWSERDVWEYLKAHGLRPHPCYYLGFSRCSCRTCVFNGPDEWATVRSIAPAAFGWHAEVEASSGKTIRFGLTVVEAADRGTPLPGVADVALVALANGTEYPDEMVRVPAGGAWETPAGAYRKGCGPS